VMADALTALQTRHASELAAHKAAMAKLPKKKRWEIPSLDEAIATRHADELRAAQANAANATSGQVADGGDKVNGDGGGDSSDEDDLLARMARRAEEQEQEQEQETRKQSGEDEQEKERLAAQKKKDKAAKKREKKAAEEAAKAAAREAEQAAIDAMGPSARAMEAEAVATALGARGLRRKEIASDGHCLYRSLSHQLERVGASDVHDYTSLRKLAATQLRASKDAFEPFALDAAEAIGLSGDDWYGEYCNSVENTAAWGGQVELQALAQALRRRIVVVCADAPDVVCGDDFAEDGALTVVYMRHAFGLGEHYDSVE